MHTQCPECNKQHQITADELRTSRGTVQCDGCTAMFDALELLTEDLVIDLPDENEIIPTVKLAKKYSPHWGLACGICIILFIFQIVFFEGFNLTQNATVRPWLAKICVHLDCQLPRYKNLDEITILHGSFEATENEHYVFKAAFINQSAFQQTLPSIQLTLLDYTGKAFAKRVFHPQEYSKHPLNLIKPEKSAEISMEIAAPSKKTGGYRFELI